MKAKKHDSSHHGEVRNKAYVDGRQAKYHMAAITGLYREIPGSPQLQFVWVFNMTSLKGAEILDSMMPKQLWSNTRKHAPVQRSMAKH